MRRLHASLVMVLALSRSLAVPAFATALLLSGPVRAADPAPPPRPWYDRVSLHGYADIYYGYNVNRPADGANFIPGTGTTGKRANNLALNLMAIDVACDLDPVAVRLVLHYGTGSEVLYAGEPRGAAIGPEVFKYVQIATISYKAPLGRGLLIEAGIMPGHVGFEVFPSKDNWNYTRPWILEFVPYYAAGIKLAYAFTDHLSAQLYLLNGWQIIGENNEAKTVGTQIAWSSDRLSAALNTLFGPELPGDNTRMRVIGDAILTVRPTAWLSLAASADVGYQQLPGQDGGPDSYALWWAAYGWARAQARPWLAFAARGGYYDDRDGFMSGTAQGLGEATLTIELRPQKSYILKIEGRYDRSTADVFATSETRPDGMPVRRNDQGLVMAGAVAAF
jgi:hypothetical protein